MSPNTNPSAQEFLNEFAQFRESGLIEEAKSRKEDLVSQILGGKHNPDLESIAREYLPTYSKETFIKVSKSIIDRIPGFTNRLVIETESGQVLYDPNSGLNQLQKTSVKNKRVTPSKGRVDIVTPHLSMTEPMIRAFVSLFSDSDMAYTIAGDNLYQGQTAQAILPLLGMCKLRRDNRTRTYAAAIVRINKALYDSDIDRVVFLQDGRGAMGLPKDVNSAILRQYLGISQKSDDDNYFISTTSVSQSFHPDMQDIIAKSIGTRQGREMNYLDFFFGCSKSFEDFGNKLQDASSGEFGLEDVKTYVTLPQMHLAEEAMDELQVSPRQTRYHDKVALAYLQKAYEMTRVMVPDIFARAILKSQSDKLDLNSAQNGFIREAKKIGSRSQTYSDQVLRLDPLIESLEYYDLKRGFEFGLSFFRALGVLDEKNQILNSTPLIFYNNKCAVHYGEHKLKMSENG